MAIKWIYPRDLSEHYAGIQVFFNNLDTINLTY